MANIVSAIQSLKPTAQFTLVDNDYSTVVWHELEGSAPTIEEIDAEIVLLEDSEKSAIAEKAAAKAALLKRLGITADEAELLIS
jgi:hypothetical protein